MQVFLRRVELADGVEPVMTVIVTAFVNNDVEPDLPSEQSVLAVRAEVFGF